MYELKGRYTLAKVFTEIEDIDVILKPVKRVSRRIVRVISHKRKSDSHHDRDRRKQNEDDEIRGNHQPCDQLFVSSLPLSFFDFFSILVHIIPTSR